MATTFKKSRLTSSLISVTVIYILPELDREHEKDQGTDNKRLPGVLPRTRTQMHPAAAGRICRPVWRDGASVCGRNLGHSEKNGSDRDARLGLPHPQRFRRHRPYRPSGRPVGGAVRHVPWTPRALHLRGLRERDGLFSYRRASDSGRHAARTAPSRTESHRLLRQLCKESTYGSQGIQDQPKLMYALRRVTSDFV